MRHDPLSPKSTNVRTESGRVVGLTLAVWGGCVALAALDGVFARLPVAVDVALAAFMALCAAGTYALDAGVRSLLDETPAVLLAVVALAGDVPLALLAFAGSGDPDRGGLALLAFFAIPLGIGAHAPLARAIARRRLSSTSGRSPGGRRVAT